MDIEAAKKVKGRCLAAIGELDSLLGDIRPSCDNDEYEILKRAVGLSIGKITMEILDVVLRQHPAIDDLR